MSRSERHKYGPYLSGFTSIYFNSENNENNEIGEIGEIGENDEQDSDGPEPEFDMSRHIPEETTRRDTLFPTGWELKHKPWKTQQQWPSSGWLSTALAETHAPPNAGYHGGSTSSHAAASTPPYDERNQSHERAWNNIPLNDLPPISTSAGGLGRSDAELLRNQTTPLGRAANDTPISVNKYQKNLDEMNRQFNKSRSATSTPLKSSTPPSVVPAGKRERWFDFWAKLKKRPKIILGILCVPIWLVVIAVIVGVVVVLRNRVTQHAEVGEVACIGCNP